MSGHPRVPITACLLPHTNSPTPTFFSPLCFFVCHSGLLLGSNTPEPPTIACEPPSPRYTTAACNHDLEACHCIERTGRKLPRGSRRQLTTHTSPPCTLCHGTKSLWNHSKGVADFEGAVATGAMWARGLLLAWLVAVTNVS